MLAYSRCAIRLDSCASPFGVQIDIPRLEEDQDGDSDPRSVFAYASYRQGRRLAPKGKAVAYAPESSPNTDDEYDAMEDVRTRADSAIARNLQAELDAEAAGLASGATRPLSRAGVVIGRSARPSGAPRRPTTTPTGAPPARSKRQRADRAPLSADPVLEDYVAPGFRYPPRGGIRPRYPVTTPVGDTPLLTASLPHRPSIVFAHLGGSVCAKILSDPLQLGPRAKTLRQEVHFSYHMQLSDRQEFLRSSRNLSQKMTPWHEEHSDGLCSQDHILRTQTRLCARPVPLKSRHIHAQQGTLGSPRIYRGQPESRSENCPQTDQKHPGGLCSRGHISQVQARISANPEPCKSRQHKLSDGTKNVKIRHRELGQICARTGTRFEKKRAGSKTHFFSRTAAFARRVFPARNKLIREPGCVGKIMTPATTWNSRFADSIPRLTGIYIGKVHKNSSDTPTSGSHNSLVRTPIHANFISLERGRRELSEDMPHDPF
uniref:Uncharacterized protein n=1 Tax=Fagus sylvatica TaxID=28930 RepID=A0A2N9GJK8_FAGSY